MAGDGAANMTAAHTWPSVLNSSIPPTRWGSRPPPVEGIALDDDRDRLIREQAYRDFTTAVQVLILIGSLLGKSGGNVNSGWKKKKKKHFAHDV